MRKILLLLLLVSCSKESIDINPYIDCIPDYSLPNPDNETGLIEGDIIPDLVRTDSRGVVIKNKSKLWENGVIHYTIQGNIYVELGVILGFENEEDKQKIHSALKDMSEKTGIIFIYHETREELNKNSPNGVSIIRGWTGGSSYLGKQGGIQTIKLPSGVDPVITQHEFSHALGVKHEFTRKDRDEYIQILWDNIPEYVHRQFAIDPNATDCGEFDIHSIMMYGSFEVKKDIEVPEILLLNGDSFYRADKMSESDIQTIKNLYKHEFEKRE